jgi:hypothetical protein
MPKFVIERNMPGAGDLGDDAVSDTVARSNDVARDLGGDVQWVRSYVTGDKVFCVYIAPSEQHLLDHSRRAGLPADAVLAVSREIDPTIVEA